MDLRDLKWSGVGLDSSYDRDLRRADVKTVMNLRFSWNMGKFLSSWATGAFSRRIRLHKVGSVYPNLFLMRLFFFFFALVVFYSRVGFTFLKLLCLFILILLILLALPVLQKKYLLVGGYILSRVGWYAWRKWRVLVRMIGFINTLVTTSINHI
jgi:hypothetical protein